MRRNVALGLALAAVLWGLVLLGGALTLPVYSGTTTSVACPGCPEVSESNTRTLVEVNGAGVLIVVALPLVVSLAVTFALWRRAWRAGAWVLVALLWLFAFLGLGSIGMFVAPAALLLTIAIALGGRTASAIPDSALDARPATIEG